MAVGATAGFSELGGAEGSLLLAKLVLDCGGGGEMQELRVF